MRRVLRENGLSLVLGALFLLCLTGQVFTGHVQYNEDAAAHGGAPVGLGRYLKTGHFLEALAENWESEFLQLFAYFGLTIWLRQKGSAESKPLSGKSEVDEDPRDHRDDRHAPWPVRRGGLALALYTRSLSLAVFALFLLSFAGHAMGGMQEYNEERAAHGEPPVALGTYVTSARFWFESFQNWQSEFLAVTCMVVFTIFLREWGSCESKPVHAPHARTGK